MFGRFPRRKSIVRGRRGCLFTKDPRFELQLRSKDRKICFDRVDLSRWHLTEYDMMIGWMAYPTL